MKRINQGAGLGLGYRQAVRMIHTFFQIGTVCVPEELTEINVYELTDSHVVVNEYPTGKTDEARNDEQEKVRM